MFGLSSRICQIVSVSRGTEQRLCLRRPSKRMEECKQRTWVERKGFKGRGLVPGAAALWWPLRGWKGRRSSQLFRARFAWKAAATRQA